MPSPLRVLLLVAALAVSAATPVRAQESPFAQLLPQGRLSSSVVAAEFSPDGKVLAVTAQDADDDGSTALLRVPDLAVLAELRPAPEQAAAIPDQVHALAFGGPDGGLLCISGRQGHLSVWDLRQRKLLTWFHPRWGTLDLRGSFLPDPRVLYVEGGALPGTLFDWTRSRGEEVTVVQSAQQFLPSPEYGLSPPAVLMRVAHLDESGLAVHRLTDGALECRLEGSSTLASTRAIAWSADGTAIAALQGSMIGVWESATGKRRSSTLAEAGPASSVVFSSDLRWAAIAQGAWSKEGESLAVWDLSQGRRAHTLPTGCPRIAGMTLAPGGRRLFVYGYAGAALLGVVD